MKPRIFNTNTHEYFFVAIVIILSLFWLKPTSAEGDIDIKLRIESGNQTIIDQTIVLPPVCEVTNSAGATSTFEGYRAVCVLQAAQEQGLLAYQVTDWGWGFSLDSINEIVNAEDWSKTWIIRVNDAAAQIGIDGLALNDLDELLLTYGPWPMEPLQAVLSTSSIYVGEEIQLTAQVWDDESNNFVDYTGESTFWINGESYNAPAGILNWTAESEGEVLIRVESPGKTRSAPVLITVAQTPEPEPEPMVNVNFNLRYQNDLIFSDQIVIPSSTTIIDSAGASHFTTSSNVLTALVAADATSTEFTIADLQYYDSWQSFYLNCIEIITPTTTSLCGSWNYVVNGVYPSIGMDAYELFGDETVYVYFSNPWKITASTSTFPVNTTTTLETWRYQYDSLEEPWTSDGNNLVDISVPNPNPTGWWDTTITTATTTTNEQGLADYLFSTTGTFYAKITSADWSKWSDPIILSVFETPTSTATSTMPDETDGAGETDDNDDTDSNPGEGPGTGPSSIDNLLSADEIEDAVDKILFFLKTQQDETGKIVDAGITDWAIMSFAANNQYADEVKSGGSSLLDYARRYDFTDPADLNICATYPRHLLALLAGGMAAEEVLITDLKNKINTECHANGTYGQNGINDDIFALFALLAVGQNAEDSIMQDIVNTVIQDQTEDGAFTWAGYAGADITGGAINGLVYAKKKGINIDQSIFDSAKQYLKNNQLSDGGWGFGASDPLTTGWVLMGINALSERQSDWTRNNKNPWSVLVENLRADGSYESAWSPGEVDWFAVKHAVPALLGRSWPIILPPKSSGNTNNSAPIGGGGDVVLYPAPTSTAGIATTTINIVAPTSTPVILESELATSTFVVTPELTEDILINRTEEPAAGADLPEKRVAGVKIEDKAEDQINGEADAGPKIAIASESAVTEASGESETEQDEPQEQPADVLAAKDGLATVQKIAKGVFAGAVSLAITIGLYMAWRLLKVLI